jgi:hypothetical protein
MPEPPTNKSIVSEMDHDPPEMKYLRTPDMTLKDSVADATTANEWAAKKICLGT